MPAAKQDTLDLLELQLQLFWGVDEVPVIIIQLPTHLVAPDGNSQQGSSRFVPQGMYFDLDVQAPPGIWPSTIPEFGPLRWLIADNLITQDFDKKMAPQRQGWSRFQRQMCNYCKERYGWSRIGVGFGVQKVNLLILSEILSLTKANKTSIDVLPPTNSF